MISTLPNTSYDYNIKVCKEPSFTWAKRDTKLYPSGSSDQCLPLDPACSIRLEQNFEG